jgi:BirA family biotin operon repressor/biotin-[acetyl-CoA-carboxylase] ligase
LQSLPRLLHQNVVDSTNAEAMRRATQGEDAGLWIVADQQTQGRGRSGRSWSSPPGNLYASLLLELRCATSTAQQLSLVAGVAAIDAINGVLSAPIAQGRLRLKWPNDILLDNAKLGGILIESTTSGTRRIGVVGIGVNIKAAPAGLGRAATHLETLGPPPERDAVLRALIETMQHWLAVWQEGIGFEAVRSAWLERAGRPGEPMSVNTGTGSVSGAFQGLDASGALLLRDAGGGDLRFTFGDVSLIGVTEPEER